MEEKKSIKISLGTVICICIIFILVIVIGAMYVYYNFIKNPREIHNDKETNTVIANNVESFNKTEENKSEDVYEKYEELYWLINDERDTTKVEYIDKIVIQNGVAYYEKNNTKTKIDSIQGNVKHIIGWGEQTLERVYVITESGEVYKSLCNIDGAEVLNKKFEKLNIKGNVINMTNGNSSIRIVEPPYFLLSTGELINEDGSSYEELKGDFSKSFGNALEQIFVGNDDTLSYYNYNTRIYTKIKDEDGNIIKMKDAFIQWSSPTYTERIFIITEDNKLLYFDGYLNVTAKEYIDSQNKTVKSLEEETEDIEYGTRQNMRVKFTDGTEILLEDAYRNFFGE